MILELLTVLSWEANPAGEKVEYYEVRLEPVLENLVEIPEITTIPTTGTSLDVGKAPPGDYLASVRAVNVFGWVSGWTEPLLVVVPPTEPPAPPVLTFSWTAEIQRSTDLREWSTYGETTITIEVPVEEPRGFFRLKFQ